MNKAKIKQKLRLLNNDSIYQVIGDVVKVWLEHEKDIGVEVTDYDIAMRLNWVMPIVQARYNQQIKDIGKEPKFIQRDLEELIESVKSGRE